MKLSSEVLKGLLSPKEERQDQEKIKSFGSYVKERTEQSSVLHESKRIPTFEEWFKSTKQKENEYKKWLDNHELKEATDLKSDIGSYLNREKLLDLYGKTFLEVFDKTENDLILFSSTDGTYWLKVKEKLVRIQ